VPGSLFDGLSPAQFAVCQFISEKVRHAYELKISFEQAESLEAVERYTILSAIDRLWQEHLYGMDSLRNSIGLRAYGQRDPLIEYKAEAFKVFEDLMVNIKTEICHNIFRSASSLMAFERFIHNLPQRTVHQSTSAFGQTGGQPGASRPRPEQRHRQRSRRRARQIQTGPHRSQGRPQRSLPVWQWQEIQALLRQIDRNSPSQSIAQAGTGQAARRDSGQPYRSGFLRVPMLIPFIPSNRTLPFGAGSA
jgi:hypothetical protein